MKDRIDEVGTLGNIAGLAAGAKGALSGASSGKGAFGKIAGAWQGAKEGSAKRKGAWAVNQWAKKLKVDFLRNSAATGDTPEAFKNFVNNAYKIDVSLPGALGAAAAPASASPVSASATRPTASAPPHAFGGVASPVSTGFGGGQKAKTTINQPYPQQYTPAATTVPAAAPTTPAPAYTGNFGPGYNQTVAAPLGVATPATAAAAAPAPAAPAPATGAAPTATNDAISALRNLGYNNKQATAAVSSVPFSPSMSTQSLISAALKSMAPPSVAAEGAISPSLGLYGDKTFSQLISEGVILNEDTVDDWCMAAAKQLLSKYPWLLDASVKYKVGSPQFAEYLQKMHTEHGYDFGDQSKRRSAPPATHATPAAPAAAVNPSPVSNPPAARQAKPSPRAERAYEAKVAAAMKKCGLNGRHAPEVIKIVKDTALGGSIDDASRAFAKIGVRDADTIVKLLMMMSR